MTRREATVKKGEKCGKMENLKGRGKERRDEDKDD